MSSISASSSAPHPASSSSLPAHGTAPLSTVVEQLLSQLEQKFDDMSRDLLTKLDTMAGRVDDLEKTITQLAQESNQPNLKMTSSNTTFHHRSTLKQTNKPYKGHSQRSTGGRQSIVTQRSTVKSQSKTDRRNHSRQLQKQARLNHLQNKRQSMMLPRLVALVPLCPDSDASTLLQALNKENTVCFEKQHSLIHQYNSLSMTCHYFTCQRNWLDVMKTCQVADLVVFLVSAKEEVDALGDQFLQCINAQGVPNVSVIVQYLDQVQEKKQASIRHSLVSYLSQRIVGVEKVISQHSVNELEAWLRHVKQQTLKSIQWRDASPYLVADSCQYDAQEQTLSITGITRGHTKFHVDRLVHLPEWGDFQLKWILDMNSETKIYPTAEQESLQSSNPVNEMLNEQTWPLDDEVAHYDAVMRKEEKKRVKVPKGTSSYQAAWFDNGDNDALDEEMKSELDDEELTEVELEQENVTYEKDNSESDDSDSNDSEMNSAPHQTFDPQFPDEIDTPLQPLAKIRFAKYRGLQSFRHAVWDKMESLPLDYQRLYELDASARKESEESSLEGVEPGTSITLCLAAVSAQQAFEFMQRPISLVVGLLKYEQKMSLMNFTFQSSTPLASKQEMSLLCGFRSYRKVYPLFSEHSRGTLHKYEKVCTAGRLVVGSIYAPMVMTRVKPPIVLFQDGVSHGFGQFLSNDPHRLLIKRLILTGHPYKVNKKSAVIRYMFHHAEDVQYFKPIQLVTKYGRLGHIKSAIGLHGKMKCVFDRVLSSQDTICLMLYKRVFPKWKQELTQTIQDREQTEMFLSEES